VQRRRVVDPYQYIHILAEVPLRMCFDYLFQCRSWIELLGCRHYSIWYCNKGSPFVLPLVVDVMFALFSRLEVRNPSRSFTALQGRHLIGSNQASQD
jgi:hypothetical protein